MTGVLPLLILFSPDTYVWLLFIALAAITAVAWLLLRASHRRWVVAAVSLLVLALWYVVVYGCFVGVADLRVRHVTYVSADLPPAFDGYRIVQFSDAHVGSFNGWRQQVLKAAVDSIAAQHADMIVFSGDLQNKRPSDIEPHRQLLSTLAAPDGVFSVLGNHDYPYYVDDDAEEKQLALIRTCQIEDSLGWTLLNNEHRVLRRGPDSIIIAGMENDGEGRFPQRGRISTALYGLSRQSFVIMLEHDPTAWRRKILRHSHCQLTLSGHTHGGQFSAFGWSPAMLAYREYDGLYHMGPRAINVTAGLGGVIPFRFGTPPEICVVTLRNEKRIVKSDE